MTIHHIFNSLSDEEKKKANAHAKAERHKSMKYDVSNREFAEKDAFFREHCEKANVKPTVRQASKYRRGLGKARQSMMEQ
jgi:hypothetical protein